MNSAPPTSDDALLGGRVKLRQPLDGYRAAVDPVLLAAAVPVKPGETVLDFGCGAGAVALCLIARVPGAHVAGVEIEPAMAALARANAAANGAADRFRVIDGDVAAAREAPAHHVAMNPPYHDAARHRAPPDGAKARANVAAAGETARWIAAGLAALRSGGTLTIVHKASALAEILGALGTRAGRVVVRPVQPAAGKPATRIIVQAVKGRRTPLSLAPALVLHDETGAYTPEVERLLRDGVALPLA